MCADQEFVILLVKFEIKMLSNVKLQNNILVAYYIGFYCSVIYSTDYLFNGGTEDF